MLKNIKCSGQSHDHCYGVCSRGHTLGASRRQGKDLHLKNNQNNFNILYKYYKDLKKHF
jgi:hypothetical protein